MKISLIIPAKNESSRIEKPLEDFSVNFNKDIEIIVVCNGCVDNTPEIVSRYMKKHPDKIKKLEFAENLGKGGALLKGFECAEGEIIGFIDADGAYRVKDAKKLVNLLEKNKGIDIAIGSKWKSRDFFSVNEPFLKKVYSRIWNLYVRVLFGINVFDTQAGLKFFKKDVLKYSNNFETSGFEFDVELLWKANKNGFSIKEIYTPNKDLPGTTFKLWYAPNMALSLFKTRIKGV